MLGMNAGTPGRRADPIPRPTSTFNAASIFPLGEAAPELVGTHVDMARAERAAPFANQDPEHELEFTKSGQVTITPSAGESKATPHAKLGGIITDPTLSTNRDSKDSMHDGDETPLPSHVSGSSTPKTPQMDGPSLHYRSITSTAGFGEDMDSRNRTILAVDADSKDVDATPKRRWRRVQRYARLLATIRSLMDKATLNKVGTWLGVQNHASWQPCALTQQRVMCRCLGAE